MREAVLARAGGCTVIIKAAAVADYRPEVRAAEKIKKTDAPLTLELVRNPDILGELGMLGGTRVLVGFAAETGRLLENAARKLAEKNLDMVVANDVSQAGAGFNGDTNIARLIFRDGRTEDLPLMAKGEMADGILDRVAELRKKQGAGSGERG
jgi:phosphopantothenoylcysteine decarboxylase/phosphopantothenate--cysteine ligase